MVPVDLHFVPSFLLPEQSLCDAEALYHCAPTEAVPDGEGYRPMSDVILVTLRVPLTEVTAVEADSSAEGASSVSSCVGLLFLQFHQSWFFSLALLPSRFLLAIPHSWLFQRRDSI